MSKRTWLTILVTVVTVLVVGGVGYGIFQAGLQQGLVLGSERGVELVAPMVGYGYRAGFFPVFGFLFPLFILFFVVSFAGRRRRFVYGPHGPAGHGAYHPMEAKFRAWHDDQHSETSDHSTSGDDPRNKSGTMDE